MEPVLLADSRRPSAHHVDRGPRRGCSRDDRRPLPGRVGRAGRLAAAQRHRCGRSGCRPLDPDLYADLAAAHTLVRDRVSIAVDGPYVAWGDLVVPAMAVQRPWVLDGEYHVDGESFETNPATWYTLATYGIAVPPSSRGPGDTRLGGA